MIDIAVKKIDELEAKLKIAVDALERIDDPCVDRDWIEGFVKEALEQIEGEK